MIAADHDTRSLPALTPVTFDGDQIAYVIKDGEQLVPAKPVCEALGIDWKSQHRKLASASDRWGMVIMTIPSPGGLQEMLCLPLSRLFGWLATISPSKVKPELRDKLVRYQRECDRVLAAHFLGQRQAETDQDVIDAWAKTNYELLERLGRALEERAALANEHIDLQRRYIRALERQPRREPVRAENHYRSRITDEEIRQMVALFGQGWSIERIARKVDRSSAVVRQKLVDAGLIPRSAAAGHA